MPLSMIELSALFSNKAIVFPKVPESCLDRQIWLRDYYGFCILFSFLYTLVVSFCTKRHSLCRRTGPPRYSSPGRSFGQRIRSYFDEYPGIPVPANLVTYRHAQVAYVAGFLCAYNIITGLFTSYYGIKQDFPNAPMWLALLYKILVMSVLTSSLMPVFIGISRGGFCCWLVGGLYCLFHVCLLVASLMRISCLSLDEVFQRLFIYIPTMAGFVYLLVYFLNEFFHELRHAGCKVMGTPKSCYHCCRESPTWPKAFILHTTRHIRTLLYPSGSKLTVTASENKHVRCYWLVKYLIALKRIFKPTAGFSYPPSLCWCLFASVLIQYYLMNQSLLSGFRTLKGVKMTIETMYPGAKKSIGENLSPDNAKSAFLIFNVPQNDSEAYRRLELVFIYLWVDIVWICLIIASLLSLILNMLNALRCLYNYQEMSIAIYQRGFKTQVSLMNSLPPHKLTEAVVAYPSYQIAFMVMGYYLQLLLFTSLFVGSAVVITLNTFTTSHAFIVAYVKYWWPSLLLMTAFITTQQLCIRFVFTQSRGRVYGFDNVRCLHLYIFLTSCYNVFFGLICSIGRLFYCPISSAVNLARLDISPLAQPMQFKDTGHVKFLGFLYADVCHNNPTARTFIWLLLDSTGDFQRYCQSGRYDRAFLMEAECCMDLLAGCGPTEKEVPYSKVSHLQNDLETGSKEDALSQPQESRRRAAIRRWSIAYTLVRNPALIEQRKTRLALSRENLPLE